ncbi:MAG: hypothetical protein M0R67_00110 [Candidatus Cloacimonas sp.]|jgi:chromosome segregation ATPase|nr:hypothetical protein [Candidatus Cloacimonas sp.]HNQ39817.1 hypothetical protein [Candidatus Cloacimonas sp.]HNS84715.1 hypothetical protein [Candidatus Cloacimonas sp.]HPX09666.1 hypothetical protein [Candidatus Cloacimonas sp.]HQM03434.1 hypothetical protein [Candidatus Cloacimonas sp.]
MESNVTNLQDKIQKLIDQYTLATKKVEELEEKNQQLTEENSQLIAQIQTSGKTTGEQEKKYKALQEEYNTLDNRYKELQKILAGLESVAESAIKKIDGLFASSEKEI